MYFVIINLDLNINIIALCLLNNCIHKYRYSGRRSIFKREGNREARTQGGREARKKRDKKKGRQGGKKIGRQGGKEIERQGSRDVGEAGNQVGREAER